MPTVSADSATANGGGSPPGGDGQTDESQDPLLDRNSRFLLLNAVPSWMVSTIVHAVVLILLAFLTIPEKKPETRIITIAEQVQETEELIEDFLPEEMEPVDVQELQAAQLQMADLEAPLEDTFTPEFTDLEAAPMEFKLEDFGEELAPKNDLMATVGAVSGKGLEGRGAESRAQMVQQYGGSKGSEAAVAMALQWLANHQLRDGGWDFDHQKGACQGRCKHPGVVPPARLGATAMALLPFLGAGQTHKEGKYKETVERGLYFLVQNMKVRNQMGDLSDSGGRLYSHGLAAITLCEAYGMTHDQALVGPAQFALNYIVYSQDPVGGGWRYQPRQPGDTSVVGWQLMALKSGHLAYLRVPKETILLSTRFLDSVQVDSGSQYGYTSPAPDRMATTAVGLLCRMYLGWKREEPALVRGVEYIGSKGPNNNMYYNYYATQVMRHFGGEPWEKWNGQIRDWLVQQQETKGHEQGSWYIEGPHSDTGGRLYCTSLATMILEVYYRHMPIYGQAAAEEDFPL